MFLLDNLNDAMDLFKTSWPVSMLYFVPILLMVANDPRLMMVNAAQEFQVYRLQQYDMPTGHHLGSQVNAVSMEAKSKSASVSRKSVLLMLDDLTLERYRTMASQYVGAIIVILPAKYDHTHKLNIKALEASLLHEEVKIPVYFIPESHEISLFYEYIEKDRSNAADVSAFQTLVDSVITDGFQFVINSAQSQPLVQSNSEFQAVNVQGRLNGGTNLLAGKVDNQKTPTIIITAHYDAFGLATSLSNGCDSNGSGVVGLLELSRLLSLLYSNQKLVPPVNILFLLTAEGKFNYHGIKKWIEEHSETNEFAGKVDLDDVLFAICLDSIGVASTSGEDSTENSLYVHVSRPPKEGQATFEFLKGLETAANYSNTKYELVHKKINLASEILAWEHERFSLNKIPAMTISHFQSYKDTDRASMTDTIDTVDKRILIKNIRLILKAIAQFAYKSEETVENLIRGDLDVSDEFVMSWLEEVCKTSRSASLLNKNHPLISNFYSHFSRYLHESIKYPVKVHPKEPEFVFYNEEQATLIIYSVKPAVFDLFLALMIAGYLGAVYLFVINFGQISYIVNRTLFASRAAVNGGGGQNGAKAKTS